MTRRLDLLRTSDLKAACGRRKESGNRLKSTNTSPLIERDSKTSITHTTDKTGKGWAKPYRGRENLKHKAGNREQNGIKYGEEQVKQIRVMTETGSRWSASQKPQGRKNTDNWKGQSLEYSETLNIKNRNQQTVVGQC